MGWGIISFLTVSVLLGRTGRLHIETYATADGLPHDSVFSIRRDVRGFLWFGTPAGLGRFDGYRFITYGTANGLSNHGITDMREDPEGNYWLATSGSGVLR